MEDKRCNNYLNKSILRDNIKKNNIVYNIEKIYPYLFKEDLYTMSFNNENFWLKDEHIDQQISFIKVKRLIHNIKYHQYVSQKYNNNLIVHYNQSLEEQKTNFEINLAIKALGLILNKNFHNLFQKHIYKLSTHNSRKYNSIAIGLLNLEYEWVSYQSIISGSIYNYLHPEIILRKLREHIEDISFLHFFRQILHCFLPKILSKKNLFHKVSYKEFSSILLNIYILENEQFFVSILPALLCQGKLQNSLNQKHSCLNKTKNWIKQPSDLIETKEHASKTIQSLYKFDNITYKYIRTKEKWLLNIESREKKWEFFNKQYINFIEKRFGYIEKSDNIRYLLPGHHNLFIGFKLQLKVNQMSLKITKLNTILMIYLKFKKIFIYIPLLHIIRTLGVYGFCNFFGYPISKSGWAILPDNNIIYRFKCIRDNLISYYTGSMNSKDLWSIQHILQYSCAKTLACKHKTNLRKIWKKYGKNLSIHDPHNQKKITFDLIRNIHELDASKKKRFWNLHLKEPYYISILVDNTYK